MVRVKHAAEPRLYVDNAVFVADDGWSLKTISFFNVFCYSWRHYESDQKNSKQKNAGFTIIEIYVKTCSIVYFN